MKTKINGKSVRIWSEEELKTGITNEQRAIQDAENLRNRQTLNNYVFMFLGVIISVACITSLFAMLMFLNS